MGVWSINHKYVYLQYACIEIRDYIYNLLFSKSTTEDREDVDGDRENLLESEIPPSEEFPESFPLSFRNLEADPFLRLQVDFRNLEFYPSSGSR